MLNKLLYEIMTQYSFARDNEQFGEHPLGEKVRATIPAYISAKLKDFHNINWYGSTGKGRWTDAPWIAGLHNLVTHTTQKGYYPVYLFDYKMSRAYLSLNQGITNLKGEHGTRKARKILEYNAQIIREQISSSSLRHFDLFKIDLKARSKSSRLGMYEPGHIIGIEYSVSALPNEETLLLHLHDMLQIYSELVFSLDINALQGEAMTEGENQGFSNRDNDRSSETPDRSDGLQTTNSGQLEVKRYKLHLRIDRNPLLALEAKRKRGYICEVCEFDFERDYGDVGQEFIEAHHIVPISELPENVNILLTSEDFRVVCANCHRMIHRPNAPKSFEEFKQYYKQRNKR
jgi:5-methylcytosine-specific restriction protein A